MRRCSGNGPVDVKIAVGRIVRVERQTKKTALARAVDCHGEERCCRNLSCVEVEDFDDAVLLDDKQMVHVAGRRGDEKRRSQTGGDTRRVDSGDLALRPIRVVAVNQVVTVGSADDVLAIIADDQMDGHWRPRRVSKPAPITTKT